MKNADTILQKENPSAFLTVKFNHTEVELDEETARELAQKGLNYDKLKESYDSLSQDEGLLLLSALAEKFGYESKEQLIAEIGGVLTRNENDEIELEALFEKYPDADIENLPEEVINDVNAGVPLAAAYEKHCHRHSAEALSAELHELKERLQKEAENTRNEQSGACRTGEFGAAGGSDYFSQEELAVLKGDSLSKNLDKALKSMSFWSKKDKNEKI